MSTETRFHRHWAWPRDIRDGGLAYRLLTKSLHTVDFETAKRSRLVYGAPDVACNEWHLTPLSLLHTLTGVTIWVSDSEETTWASDPL